jgi:hypothetical protein
MKGYVEQIGWYLVRRIFSMQEASQTGDASQPNVPGVWRRRRSSPIRCGGNTDVCIAPIGGELSKPA